MIDLDLIVSITQHYKKNIEDLGYTVTISNDFEELARVSKKLDHGTTPHFDPNECTLCWGKAFWIDVKKKNKTVCFVAAKFQEIGNEPAMKYIMRDWARAYKSRAEKLGVKYEFAPYEQQADRLKKITGNLVYSGEWFAVKDHRGEDLAKNLGNLVKCMSFLQWQHTDYFWIGMQNKQVRTGLAACLEISDVVPDLFQWQSEETPEQPDLWLVGMCRDDFEDWARTKLRQAS